MTGVEFTEVMRSLGHTQASLADIWGVSRPTIGRLCRSEVDIERPYADALRYLAVCESVIQLVDVVVGLDKKARRRLR